jgi:hypothetical protein
MAASDPVTGGYRRWLQSRMPVGRSQAIWLTLALENAELMAERQKLSSEFGVTLALDEQGIHDESDEGIHGLE